jgi:hypothetical protein
MAAMGATDVNARRRRTRTLQVGVAVVAVGVAVMAIRSAPTRRSSLFRRRRR